MAEVNNRMTASRAAIQDSCHCKLGKVPHFNLGATHLRVRCPLVIQRHLQFSLGDSGPQRAAKPNH